MTTPYSNIINVANEYYFCKIKKTHLLVTHIRNIPNQRSYAKETSTKTRVLNAWSEFVQIDHREL